jgi:L-seryl-tRNA(Ser) seleniumtransferase
MFVVSHHTAQYGYVQLTKFVELCHRRGIPVIVDGAAQDHQIARLVASGADLIVVSLQKYLAGPTGGIVCGRKDLVRSVYLQNLGIGRPMKIGKEGLFGAMIALEERMELDLDQWAAEQIGKATFLASQLTGIPGIDISLVPDAVGQPVTRVRLSIDEATTGISAEAICQALRGGTPTIKPRSHHTDEGWFFLEPNHITEEEMVIAANRIREIVANPDHVDRERPGKDDAFLAWLS